MADVAASPSDPIFYMHHTFIDHTFRIWQNADVADRTTSINGVDAEGVPLTMDTLVYMGNIMPAVPISALLNTEGGVVINGFNYCYRYNY
jgi:tyrosinase